MKQLNTYIQEGLFDNVGVGVTEENIKTWIKNHFLIKDIEIIFKDNKYIVNSKDKDINIKIESETLTNGQFEWGKVKNFDCYNGKNLISLEGAPRECDIFDCCKCNKLKNLKGAPDKCNIVFTCQDCENLISLEGAPKDCRKFTCSYCHKLINLKGAPEKCKEFSCISCNNLVTLDGIENMKCDDFYYNCCHNLKSKNIPNSIKRPHY